MNFQLLRSILNFALVVACLSHIGINAFNELYPDIPSVKQYKADLGNIDFPVSFTICIREIDNDTDRYKAYGYARDWGFFNGKSIKKGLSQHRRSLHFARKDIILSGLPLLKVDFPR